MREYERVNQAIAALELQGDSGAEFVGQRNLFDLNKTILNSNLYGVDLSPEAAISFSAPKSINRVFEPHFKCMKI